MNLRILTVLACLLLPAAASAVPVPNPSFEDADPLDPASPAHWSMASWGDLKSTLTWVEGGRTGKRCVRAEVTAAGKEGDAKWWSDPITPDAGTAPYLIGTWYRSNVKTHLYVMFSDGAQQNEFLEVAVAPSAAAWTRLSGAVIVPPWVKQLRVLQLIDQVGFLEVDDVNADRGVKTGKRPLVSITFDDGWVSAYNTLIPKMAKYGYKGTHFIISGYMDKPGYQADYITHKQVKKLLADGHEVGSHTLLHEDMAQMTDQYLVQNMTESRAELEKFGSQIRGIAPPFGSYNDHARERAAETYQYLRTVKHGLNLPPYQIHELLAVVVTWQMTLAEVEDLLTEAEYEEGAWVVLLFHRAALTAEDIPVDSLGAYVMPSRFQEMMDLLKKHDADVRPMGEILGVWKATPLPPEPTAAVVEGGKSLPPPSAVQRFGKPSEPGASGCDARPVAAHHGPWLLALLAGLLLRRRRTA